ncbi:hypothetical protein CI238_07773, partial [Colletotrichum incanum]
LPAKLWLTLAQLAWAGCPASVNLRSRSRISSIARLGYISPQTTTITNNTTVVDPIVVMANARGLRELMREGGAGSSACFHIVPYLPVVLPAPYGTQTEHKLFPWEKRKRKLSAPLSPDLRALETQLSVEAHRFPGCRTHAKPRWPRRLANVI